MNTGRGTLFVISAPSGAGKTTLVKALLARGVDLAFPSPSPPGRPHGQGDGRDYFFVDDARFARMVEAGEFLEHARVFDHSYGAAGRRSSTPRRGPQRPSGNRLAGRAAGAPERAKLPKHLHRAAVRRRARTAPVRPRDRPRGRHPPPPRRRLRPLSLARIRLPDRQHDLDEALAALEPSSPAGRTLEQPRRPVRSRLEAMLAGV